MVGDAIITSQMFFAFAQMEQSQLPSSTCLGQFMTVRSPNGGTSMTILSQCMLGMVVNAPLIQRLDKKNVNF